MPIEPVLDFDQLIASGEIDVDPMQARPARLMEHCDEFAGAMRADPEILIELAKAASKALALGPDAHVDGTESKADRRRRISRESYHRLKAQRDAGAISEPTD